MIEAQIEQDLKTAMLARDSAKVSTLRSLKSAILYTKVAEGTRGEEMPDDEVMKVLQKEAKKRQESADLYNQGHEEARANQESAEKAIIENYLPAKISEKDLEGIVDQVIDELKSDNMGQIVGEIKNKTAGQADGADIARLVKAKLNR